MLPKTGSVIPEMIQLTTASSKTFAMHLEDKRISGYVDGAEAVRQAVYCILNTERYDHLIYSWNYGIELNDLYGRPMPYVKSELKRRIKEALMQDDRILGVEAFSFSHVGGTLSADFNIRTVFGEIKGEKEVMI